MTGHILVMDDDEMILNLAKEMIETFGYSVDTTVDGKEAIEKYITAKKSGKAFDVVIMDLTIPGGMGGKEYSLPAASCQKPAIQIQKEHNQKLF